MITQQELKQLFIYKEGVLYYRHASSRPVKAGQRAGTPSGNSTKIEINKKRYWAHNLIWILHRGEIPEGWRVRRIEGTSDKISNLRLRPILCSTSHS